MVCNQRLNVKSHSLLVELGLMYKYHVQVTTSYCMYGQQSVSCPGLCASGRCATEWALSCLALSRPSPSLQTSPSASAECCPCLWLLWASSVMLALFAERYPSQSSLLCWVYHLESCMLAAFSPTSRSIASQGLCKDTHMFLLYCDPFLVAQGAGGHTFSVLIWYMLCKS